MNFQDEKIDWNLNKDGSQIVGKLIYETSNYLSHNQPIEAYNTLLILFNSIEGHKNLDKLTNEKDKVTKEEIETAIIKIKKILPERKPSTDAEVVIHKEIAREFREEVLLLHKLIMRLLHRSGLWFTVFEKDSLDPIKRS